MKIYEVSYYEESEEDGKRIRIHRTIIADGLRQLSIYLDDSLILINIKQRDLFFDMMFDSNEVVELIFTEKLIYREMKAYAVRSKGKIFAVIAKNAKDAVTRYIDNDFEGCSFVEDVECAFGKDEGG